ncbi:MAG: hypothetical protein CV090_01375 [Nitrospira sp. WS238]|nr:hypothetical protein [Nitrospira sp. WS238]
MSLDDDRLSRWLEASYHLDLRDLYLVVMIQGLGRLDCFLIQKDNQLSGDTRSIERELSFELEDQFALSALWVFGAYEIVRTLDQQAGNLFEQHKISKTFKDSLNGLKHKFERVRVPLAKLEPSRRFKDQDLRVATAEMGNLGVRWRLNENTYVDRRELANSFLNFLEDSKRNFWWFGDL